MSSDQEKGLDGIITSTDAKMLAYYAESLKYKSNHWFISKSLISSFSSFYFESIDWSIFLWI